MKWGTYWQKTDLSSSKNVDDKLVEKGKGDIVTSTIT